MHNHTSANLIPISVVCDPLSKDLTSMHKFAFDHEYTALKHIG